jgi:hypothetical protein
MNFYWKSKSLIEFDSLVFKIAWYHLSVTISLHIPAGIPISITVILICLQDGYIFFVWYEQVYPNFGVIFLWLLTCYINNFYIKLLKKSVISVLFSQIISFCMFFKYSSIILGNFSGKYTILGNFSGKYTHHIMKQ